MQERRLTPRIARNIPLKILHNQSNIITETKNISISGVYFQSEEFLPLMTKLDITILLPENNKKKAKKCCQVKCSGAVVRVEPNMQQKYHVAVFFNEMREREKQKLENYIKQHIS